MKKIISLVLVVTMVIAFLNPVFASQNYNDNMVGDTANNDIKCRMSDLFYSYPSLLLYSTGLQEHSANLAMIEANVTNEYVTTPAFYISSILYGTSIATNKKELTKYIFDKVGITNFAEEKYMDDANTKLLKALCAYNFEYGWFENAGDMVSSGKNITSELNILNQIFTFANKASEYALLQSGMSKEQLYKDYFSYALAKLKDECTYINPDDWTIINGQFYTYSSEISEALSGTTDIINFITGFASSILTYNYYIKITDEIMEYAPKNSDLYIGMKWQKNRLMAGFVTTYGIEKIEGEALGKIAGLGSDLIKEIGNKNLSEFNKSKSLFDLVSLSVNMVCNFILDNTGLTKPDDYFTELVLAQYSNDMYNYLSNKVEATIMLTNLCNLNCVYCYESNKSKREINVDIACSIINKEMLLDDGYECIEFNLFGGEPFLKFDIIKAIYLYLESKKYNKEWKIGIITNGSVTYNCDVIFVDFYNTVFVPFPYLISF